MQGDVINNLGKIKDLLVIGRTSTQQYRDTVKTLRQIGEELQVRYLVEGSVRRAGDQVRIGVQLIDSQTGANVWGDTYDRSLDDIFAIQAEVAKRIAGQLKAVILPEEIKQIDARPTNNQEAYDLWLKHRHLTQSTPRNWENKIELLEQALALDPEFAEAWAFLSIEYLFLVGDDPELIGKSRRALQTAENLDPDSPFIPVAQSFYESMITQDVERSIELLLNALEIDPGFTLARRPLGRQFKAQGRLVEAQQVLEAFHRSDPLDQVVEKELIRVYAERQLWDQAGELATIRFGRIGDREMLTEVENLISDNK